MLYERFYAWYSKNYRALILIPVIVFLSAMFIFYNNWQATGEFFPKDIDLSGGTVVSVYTSVVPEGVKEEFESRGFSFREIHSYETGELVAVSIEAGPGFSPQEVALLVMNIYGCGIVSRYLCICHLDHSDSLQHHRFFAPPALEEGLCLAGVCGKAAAPPFH